MTTYFEKITGADNMINITIRDEVRTLLEGDLEETWYPELDEAFTVEELVKAVKNLKNGKAPGEDGLLNEIFKSNDFLLPSCLELYNQILASGTFPKCWTTGVIIPLHKKGDVNSISNYRGITLLPIMSKLFTKLVNA